jgi:hypothetical protein
MALENTTYGVQFLVNPLFDVETQSVTIDERFFYICKCHMCYFASAYRFDLALYVWGKLTKASRIKTLRFPHVALFSSLKYSPHSDNAKQLSALMLECAREKMHLNAKFKRELLDDFTRTYSDADKKSCSFLFAMERYEATLDYKVEVIPELWASYIRYGTLRAPNEDSICSPLRNLMQRDADKAHFIIQTLPAVELNRVMDGCTDFYFALAYSSSKVIDSFMLRIRDLDMTLCMGGHYFSKTCDELMATVLPGDKNEKYKSKIHSETVYQCVTLPRSIADLLQYTFLVDVRMPKELIVLCCQYSNLPTMFTDDTMQRATNALISAGSKRKLVVVKKPKVQSRSVRCKFV